MSNNVDKKIKNSLNKNIEKVPKSLDSKIEDTLKGLKRKRNYKKQAIVASIIAFSFVGLGISTYSYANKNKIQSDIFDEFYISQNYKEYGIKLDKVLEKSNESNKNIREKEVKIESIVYDGYTVIISYKITGLEKKEEVESIFWKIEEDGKQLFDAQMGTFQEEEGSLRGVATSKIKKEKNRLNLEISAEINGEKYKLKEKIEVVRNKEAIREVRINKEIDGSKLKKLIITPMYLYLEMIPNKDIVDDEGMKIETLDGKEFQWTSSEMNTQFKIKSNFSSMYINNYKNIQGIRIKGKEKNIVITEKGEVYEEKN